jgi:transcriptional regulator with XRE-family HTH domain
VKEWALTAESARHIREVIGGNILRERERAGMSRNALAALSDIDAKSIKRYEGATTEPSLRSLLALSFALRVPLNVLLLGLPEPSGIDE